MRCYHCGHEVPNNAESCPNCGAGTGAGDTVLLDQTSNPYDGSIQTERTGELTTLLEGDPYAMRAEVSAKPAIQFATDRKLWKMIVFGLLTFGIYDLVVWCQMITELNVAACRYDGKRTMPYFAAAYLTAMTFGIYGLVWNHKLCERMSEELNRRGYEYKFGTSTFWLWGVLGSLIVVGPFVYLNKLLTVMNTINADFNENG